MRIIFYTILVTVGLALSVIILVPSFFDINTYKNKLYKCPPVANLLDIKPGYTNYTGYSHNDDISEFIQGIGKPEPVCAMCPEQQSHSVDHYAKENVYVKNID